MKKRIVRIGIPVIIICLLGVIYFKEYHRVNQIWRDAPVEVFSKNEKVYMEDDILMDFTMKGYAIEVNHAEIMDYKDFLKKYDGEDEYTYVPDRVYEVTVTLWNEDAEDGVGINLQDFYISGTATYTGINTLLLDLANPDLKGSTAIALRRDSRIEMHLPFNLNRSFFREKIWNNLSRFDMRLVVTLYPVKKEIRLIS